MQRALQQIIAAAPTVIIIGALLLIVVDLPHIPTQYPRILTAAAIGLAGLALRAARQQIVTQQQRMSQSFAELQASEQTAGALLRSIPDLMLRVDSNGTIVDLKPPRGDSLLEPRALLGQQLPALFPPATAAALLEHLRRALALNSSETWEYQAIEDGRPHKFEARILPSGADEVLLLVRDITERKRAEASLRASDATLARLALQRKRLLEVAHHILATLTLEEIVAHLPEKLGELISYASCGFYLIDRPAGLLRPLVTHGSTAWLGNIDDWPIPLEGGIVGEVIESGRGELVNNAHLDPRTYYPPDASVTCEHLIVLPLQNQGEILGACLLARTADPPFTAEDFEIVELFVTYASLAIANARLFDRMQRSERRLRAAMEGSMDSVLLLESIRDSQHQITEFLIVDVNPTAVQLIGRPYEEIVGQRLCELLPLNRQGEFFEKYVQVVETGRPLDEEFTIDGGDRTLWRYHQVVPLGDGIAITSRDITERKQAEEALMQLATIDMLTGVLNRRHLFILAKGELARAQRYDRDLTVIMFDIDNFKQVNDTHGHLVGDRVLQQVAEQSRLIIRTIDLLGRYGGEEFILVLPEVSLDAALQVAERMRLRIAEHRVRVGALMLQVTASFGVACCSSGDANTSIEDLIDAADRALYQAKRRGKNCVVCADDIAGQRPYAA